MIAMRYAPDMAGIHIPPSEGNTFQFRGKSAISPLATLTNAPATAKVTNEQAAVGQPGEYATTFNPEPYRELRRYVQSQGWNVLLDGVTFHTGDTVVDLGFGDGGNTALLAKDLREHGVNCRVFGIEKSAEMVASARTSYAQNEHPNLILLEGSAEHAGTVLTPHLMQGKIEERLPSLTHVISNYTLHWVRDSQDPSKFLHEEMFRSLNPLQPIGGVQRHFCAHRDAFKELFEAGYNVIRRDSTWKEFFELSGADYSENGEWRHPSLVTRDGILEALSAAGYTGTAELHTDERIFPNAEILKEWVKTMIRPFMCRVPVLRQGQFVDDWIQEYLSTTGQRGTGPVVLVDRNLLVIARKERA